MEQTDLDLMRQSIDLAKQCQPVLPEIPKVGAVIAVGARVLGMGRRGNGTQEDGDHAEFCALRQVEDRANLSLATVYTTLEPCTPDVRSSPLHCCTELIRQAGVKRVYIGILDPNQGVPGKGLWELQERGIDVELYPPALANEIRSLNSDFIRTQRTLGIRIISPPDGERRHHPDLREPIEVKGTFINPPGEDIIAFTRNANGYCIPQQGLTQTSELEWKTDVYFSDYGLQTVSIVKLNDLGQSMTDYYRRVAQTIIEREAMVLNGREADASTSHTESFSPMRQLRSDLIGIRMDRYPKGIEVQDSISIKLINLEDVDASAKVITHLPELWNADVMDLFGRGRFVIKSYDSAMGGRRHVELVDSNGKVYDMFLGPPRFIPREEENSRTDDEVS